MIYAVGEYVAMLMKDDCTRLLYVYDADGRFCYENSRGGCRYPSGSRSLSELKNRCLRENVTLITDPKEIRRHLMAQELLK